MDVVELLWTSVLFVFAIIFVFFITWYGRPENKAYLLRKVTKKNYIVATVRHGGGQLREHVVRMEAKKDEEKMPTIRIGDRDYLPIEKVTHDQVVQYTREAVDKEGNVIRDENGQPMMESFPVVEKITDNIVNFKSSVPYYFFNYDDTKPIAFSGVDIEQKFRNPSFINSIIMQIKALYKTKAIKDVLSLIQSMKLLLFLCLGGMALLLIADIALYMQIQGTQEQVMRVGLFLNNTIQQAVVNQFP